MKRFINILFLWVLLWFCADVCGRWLVYMKIETSCNGLYGDVYMGFRTSQNECLLYVFFHRVQAYRKDLYGRMMKHGPKDPNSEPVAIS